MGSDSSKSPERVSLPPRWRRWGRLLLDLVYPPGCPGCDTEILRDDATGWRPPLCAGCEAKLEPLVPPFCQVCGMAYSSGNEAGFRCANCGGRRFDFEFAIAPYLARGLLRELVHQFKFGRVAPLRRPLGCLMARVFDDPRLAGREWALVPVPIHRKRRRQRTFNQAEELAGILSEITGHPVLPALRRVVFTPPQSRLSREQRLENLQSAIEIIPEYRERVRDRELLLVDDIFTTGSTGQACAAVLKSNGARKVVVITLGRG